MIGPMDLYQSKDFTHLFNFVCDYFYIKVSSLIYCELLVSFHSWKYHTVHPDYQIYGMQQFPQYLQVYSLYFP